MSRSGSNLLGLALAVGLLQSCVEQRLPTQSRAGAIRSASAAVEQPTGRYVVVFSAERVPADFGARIATLGGSVEASMDSIGVAVVAGLTGDGATQLAGAADTRYVESDVVVSPRDDGESTDSDAAEAASEPFAAADATASPTTAQFYARQWNLPSVLAPEAWAAGYLGSRDVVVAIIDSGIDYTLPDLEGLVDLERSTSLVPEENVAARFPGRLPFSDLFWHGTAVASIVASNAKILAGVNRYVTLLAVKVADSTNQSSAGRFLAGIVYAADHGADVANLSNGRQFDKSVNPGIVAAFDRAVNYAFRRGMLLVSTPFNDSTDLDHNGDKVRLPCEAANALCVSATAPTAADGVNGPWYNVDAIASYTAFGRSAIDVAAPGGSGLMRPNVRVWLPCTTTTTATTGAKACRSGPAPRLAQGQGTSFSAPHVAGLAALLVAQLGHGNPGLVRERILQSADDLGEPGVDPYYGHGRINVARALGVLP